MVERFERWLRTLGLIVAGGLVIGVGAYLWSSQVHYSYLGGPGIHVISSAGFDPWTGLPHGATIEYRQVSGDPYTFDTPPRTEEVPADIEYRRAIPVPIGFAVGLLITSGVLLTTRLRRRTPVPANA